MRVAALLNAAAGTVAVPAALVREALTAAGLDAEVRAVPGERLAEAARAAADSGVDAVVAGGGDGTVSAVAGALADRGTPLGVLPLGTLNHFARDLAIPLNLSAAARLIAAARARPV